MTKPSKTVVFFGNERLATGVSTTVPILRSIINDGYEVKAVVANHEISQSRNTRQLEIAGVAKDNQLPLLLPKKLSEILDRLHSLNAEIGILVAYGKIIPQVVIDLFPLGIINVHPSLLPRHRGPTPIESAILDGDEKTGVSIMQLAAQMDSGAVYAQAEYQLTGNESKQSLADSLGEIGRAMLIDLLPGIMDRSLVALPQDNEAATYDRLLIKDDGVIDWSKPAVVLEREVRAFINWPKSRARIGNIEAVITGSTVVDRDLPVGKINIEGKSILVGTGQRSLAITSLKPSGKPEMSIEAFLAGYAKSILI